ncbi:receptor-type tyrosine-protein phosphatase delta-like [Watersipora subatra]|uniref:receptor-type tyrosine-protein phosphatase delta-like n=1 Tax=Watersipora subatra TaxID=2589382 RepID=UPI00355B46F3
MLHDMSITISLKKAPVWAMRNFLCLAAVLLTCTAAENDNSTDPYGLRIIDIGTHWIAVNWTDPKPLQSFKVDAEPDNDQAIGIHSTYSIYGALRTSHEYEFDFLTPYTNYTLTVEPFTSDPSVPAKQPVRATTLQYAPGKVSILHLAASHDNITVQWKEPEQANGVIEEYYISINTNVIVYNITVNGSITEITVRNGIKPNTTYTVTIAAKTGYGWGDTYYQNVTTLVTYPSGTPANFIHSDDITSYSTELYWEEILEDERNGYIAGYRLRYMDRGKQHEVYTKTNEYRFDNLTQDTFYTFYLSGYVVNNKGRCLLGPEAILELTTLQSAPAPPVYEQLRNYWLVDELVTSNQITFVLTENVLEIFSQDNGDITQYQILVIKSDSNDEFRQSGYTENMTEPLTWNQAKRKSFREPYAISLPQPSPASWSTTIRNRRTTSSQSEITIGSESCDSRSQYCNGPLQALKTYCVYARGWTKNDFYTDSDCLALATTKYNLTALIVGIVVAVGVLLLVFGVVFYCVRKNRKPKSKPRLRKDAVPLPKTPRQKDGQETYDYIESTEMRSSYIDFENEYCDPDDVHNNKTTAENGYILDAATVQE